MKKALQISDKIMTLNNSFIHRYRNGIAKIGQNEVGQTAILSVIFFSIVMMVLVVSFMKTISAVQAAATNNELQASAMASAESGVEDAKRVLSYCSSNALNSDCVTINNPIADGSTCTASGSASKAAAVYRILVNALGSTKMSNGDIKVGVQSANTEAYSCLIINRATSDFVGTLTSDGDSRIVPLNLIDKNGVAASASFVVVQWANNLPKGAVGSDNTASPITGTNLPNIGTWGAAPAVMRVELSSFAVSDTVESMTDKMRAVTIRPSTGDGTASSSVPLANNLGSITTSSLGGKAYSFDSWVPQATVNSESTPLLQRNCSTAATTGYYCNVAFTESGGFNQYTQSTGAGDYLRLQATYNSTHFRVTAYDANGNQLYFNGVQPTVDSTGRTADAFYRVLDRLQVGGDSSNGTANNEWYPDFAIDSGGSICKNMTVKNGTGSDNCTY